MHGVLFLSFLFNAAIAFSKNPERVRFGWISKADAAKALKRLLRSSVYINREIRDLKDQDLFDWVKRNDASQRYRFIRAVRRYNPNNLPPELLNDDLNLGFVDVNRQASGVIVGAQVVTAKGEAAPVQARVVDDRMSALLLGGFLGRFFPEDGRNQHPTGRLVEDEIKKAQPEEEKPADPAEEERLDPDKQEAEWRAHAARPQPSSATLPPAPPLPLAPIIPPSQGQVTPVRPARSWLADRFQNVGHGLRQAAAATRIDTFSQFLGSKAQIVFRLQVFDRVANFISDRLNGAESRPISGAISQGRSMVSAGRALTTGARGAGARAGTAAAARLGAMAVPGLGEAMLALNAAQQAKKASKLVLWLVIGISSIFFLSAFTTVNKNQIYLISKDDGTIDLGNGGAGGGGSGGGSCTTQSQIDANKNSATCQYLNPNIDIFDVNISSEAIQTYVNKYSSVFVNAGVGDKTEFQRRVDYIVSQSKKVGLNPVIFLGYWKSESLFSTDSKTTADLGCAPGQGRKSFEVEVDCAVGLTPEGGSLTSRCASPTNPNKSGCTKTIKTLDDFAEGYGSKSVDPNNCSHTYNILLEVASELNACKAGGSLTACEGGWPTTGTVTQGPKGLPDHAGIYSSSNGGRQAIDIANVTGSSIYSTFNGTVRAITDDCIRGDATCAGGFGNNIVLNAKASNGTSFDIVFAHLSQGSAAVKEGQTIQSGTKLGLMGSTGLSFGDHLHYELKGVGMATPYIPQDFADLACDSPDGKNPSTNKPCSPLQVTYSTTDCSQVATKPPSESGYWFNLVRRGPSSIETLYLGPYGDADKSQPVPGFINMRVNPGASGKTPTPLPQTYFRSIGSNRDYWLVTHMRSTTSKETDPNGNFHMGDHFIILDVAGDHTDPYFGPVPYEECSGAGPNGQCNWVYAGFFGLHGVSDRQVADNIIYINEGGSNGCIRHDDETVNKLFDFFVSKGYQVSRDDLGTYPAKFQQDQIRYYIQDGGSL